jgi:hypothetical protein
VLDRDDHRRQPGGQVAVHPIALHSGADEPTAVDVDYER